MRIRRSRMLLVFGAGIAIIGGAGVATQMVAHADTAACKVQYTVTTQSSSDFTAEVSVTNLGEPISPWALKWSFRSGQIVTSGWNGVFSQSDQSVTVTNARRTTRLSQNRTITVGFTATSSASNTAPTSFTLNGAACTSDVASQAPQAPAASPSLAPGSVAPSTPGPST